MKVPQHPQHPTAGENTECLFGRAVWIGPMPGLREEHGVDLVRAERELLGSTGSHVGLRDGGREHGTHPVVGLDRDHVKSAINEKASEFAGSRSDVDDTPGADRQHRFQSGGGIRRAPLLIQIGHRPE
jgi:hypothetical protein